MTSPREVGSTEAGREVALDRACGPAIRWSSAYWLGPSRSCAARRVIPEEDARDVRCRDAPVCVGPPRTQRGADEALDPFRALGARDVRLPVRLPFQEQVP